MKAILVIDIGDEEIEDLAINYLLYRSSEGMVIDGDMGAVLKPMPTKKEHSEEDNPYSDNYEDEYEYQYREGYNTCLREITGETE